MPCPAIARRGTRTTLADVALENMPYLIMNLDALSPCAMSYLPSGSSARPVCHSKLEYLLSYLAHGTRLARLPALFTMLCSTKILHVA